MNETERIHELDKVGAQFNQFIIAVNGALIAYSFKQVEDRALTFTLILLGVAIIFWAFSFYSGVTSIRRLISTRIVDVFRSRGSVKANSEYANMASEKIKELIDEANSLNKRMFTFLYLGGCSYAAWEILEMYLRTRFK